MTAGVHVITWIMSCHLSLRHLLPRRSYSSVSLAPSVTTCHPPYFWGAVENNGRGGGGTFQFVAGQNTTPGVVVAPTALTLGTEMHNICGDLDAVSASYDTCR